MENQKKKPEWYNKKSTVILWCIFFFPVGLYAIWKSSVIPKGWKIGYTILIAILFIISQNKEKTNKNNDVKTDKIANAIKVNIDSLINLVKKDSLFEIKDVYYNTNDSSLNIAITNKGNVIKEKDYSTVYFDKTYHLDGISCIDGVFLYAYKKGHSLKKGDYKEYLIGNSKRVGRITNMFKEKYCSENRCVPLEVYLKQSLNDPDSYESDELSIDWQKDSSFVVVNSFRAKNAFGAMILNKCSAIVDINGNVSNFKIGN